MLQRKYELPVTNDETELQSNNLLNTTELMSADICGI